MAEVKNNSTVNILRTRNSGVGAASVQNLGNKIFNGYVYSFSLDVGLDGQPTTVTLNLALDKTLKSTPITRTISQQRKETISRVDGLVASRENIGVAGNVDSRANIGTFDLSQIDKDFNITEDYLSPNYSYSISITNGSGQVDYQLKNFRIVSYSINKNNDQKLLTLVMRDVSFVLSKVYVGILGQEMALDSRSEIAAVIDQIKLSCPPINTQPGGQVTYKNLTQNLHFAEEKLAGTLRSIYNASAPDLEVITDSSTSTSKKNFIIIRSKNSNKQIINGYGAVIILGEEDFKDGPCSSAEMLYSFDTLLAAMEALNITSVPAKYLSRSNNKEFRTLKDKSNGRIKRNYRGNLKEVLGQWCDEYAYSYMISFSTETGASTAADSNILIHGIDLSSPTSKQVVADTKKQIEELEASSQQDFVIKQQNFSYDLAQKALRLYSSYYFKDARDKSLNYESILRDLQFNAMNLADYFPGIFGNGSTTKDFSGATRSYEQVIISAILGKFCPKLRQIYNMSINAPQALGFMPMNTSMAFSKVSAVDNAGLIFQEAATSALDLQADVYYDATTALPMYDMYFGFFNANLAGLIEKIENFIADFIGVHYLSDEVNAVEGLSGNGNFLASYAIETSPATQKIFSDQVYRLEPLRQFNFLVNELAALFAGSSGMFDTFRDLQERINLASNACLAAGQAYQNYLTDATVSKRFRFYYKRDAAYGVLQELINDIQNLKYRFDATTEEYSIDLAEIYAPTFRQLSPVSLGALQAALPINVSAIPSGNYKFGILLNFRNNIFSFDPLSQANRTNPIEYFNFIRERCAVIADSIATGNQNAILDSQQTCNKTILYMTCIRSQQNQQTQDNYSDQLRTLSGPDPLLCQAFTIKRGVPPAQIVQANINKTLISSQGFLTLNPTPLTSIFLTGIRNNGRRYIENGFPTSAAIQYEVIVLPSQISFPIRLKSKTNQQILMPFENYVKGGLENTADVRKIINNEGSSVDIFLNNITPNVRELFGDQTTPEYVTSSYVQGAIEDGTPYIMDYVGYGQIPEGLLPKYQFLTFQQFHNALSEYYNDRSLSYNQPAVTYSVEIFCNSIGSTLRNLLSVFNGMSSLNISLGDAGMTIQAQFRSYPAKIRSVESLINRNRPNIKLINTNFLK